MNTSIGTNTSKTGEGPTYNPFPITKISDEDKIIEGVGKIVSTLRRELRDDMIFGIEVYPGVNEALIFDIIRALNPSCVVHTRAFFKRPEEIHRLLERDITDDRILGRRTLYSFEDLVEEKEKRQVERALAEMRGLRVVWGTGASLIRNVDELLYVDVTRWEIQMRYRTNRCGNWMTDNLDEDPQRKIKQGYFVDWVMADKLKRELGFSYKWYMDATDDERLHLIETTALLEGYRKLAWQPFRLKPFFDKGVWGGHWMQETFKVQEEEPNLAWAFDGVPEENSLLLRYGDKVLETPAQNLVFAEPVALLGRRVYGRFGTSFPIRFNILDTMGGQNLSLQVHPQTDYIRDVFGMAFTQDESYYVLDAKPRSHVYIGVKKDIDRERMVEELYAAERGEMSFDAEKYINTVPVKKHDHIAYPGGTIHCSGKDMVVLEISSTPNRFTFKLWDWDRVDLDGLPRPINLGHGLKNIAWERDTDFVRDELFDQIKVLEEGEGYRVERTGLHELEFIETIRHWFRVPVRHEGNGSVRTLHLVEGEWAWVESLNESFEPFEIHYGETFIVPASVGDFIIRPGVEKPERELATIEARVR